MSNADRPERPPLRWLERATAAVLVVVVVAMCWMLVAAYRADWLRLPSEQAEVIVMVVLLSVALGLVSVVALLHTRT
jgi:hypothetical protein